MSSIDKLTIRGIRAFNPNEEQKIEFQKPLTLILGQNGAGKTTIIESLRTMTAGSMPPHTLNGKTFLHDPRISNQAETKAALKLKFNSNQGKEIFAMRSYQLLNRKNKQEFKKMEQVLKSKDERGQTVSVSHNCAQMDKFVPMLLGVSNAILENVIFCHQDESNWPFSDQANLKKIFDEVFDTTKYTKALNELRVTSKKYSKYAKEFKHELELKMKTYEQYTNIRRKIRDLGDHQALLQEKSQKLEVEKDSLEAELTQMKQDESRFIREAEEMRCLMQQLTAQKKELFAVQAELGLTGLMNDSEFQKREQELEASKDQYQSIMNQRKQEQSELESAIESLRAQEKHLEDQLRELQGKKSMNQKQMTERRSELKQISERLQTFMVSQKDKNLIIMTDENGLVSATILQQLITQLTSDRDQIQKRYQQLRQQNDRKIKEKDLAICEQETQSVCDGKNLDDTNRQISDVRHKLQRLGGQNQGQDPEEEMREVQTELSTIQQQLCKVAQELRDKFGIEETKIAQPDISGLISPESCGLADQGSESRMIAELVNLISVNKEQLSEMQDERLNLKKMMAELTEQNGQYIAAQDKIQLISSLQAEFDQFEVQANQLLRILYQGEANKVIIKDGVNTDFDSIMNKVHQMFQNQNITGEIAFLRKLRILFQKKHELSFQSEAKEKTMPEIMNQIDSLVKMEVKQDSTKQTMSKLIKHSQREKNCFLCKQGLNEQLTQNMTANFPVEDDKQGPITAQIKQRRESLNTSFTNLIETGCECGSMSASIAVIDNQIETLETRQQNQQEVDQRTLNNLLFSLKSKAHEIKRREDANLPSANEIKEKVLFTQQAILQNKSVLERLSSEIESIIGQNEVLQGNRESLLKELFNCKLEYNKLNARKYKLMSKSKRQVAERAAQQDRGNEQAVIEELQAQLLDLTHKQTRLEQDIESRKINCSKLRKEVEQLRLASESSATKSPASQEMTEVGKLKIQVEMKKEQLEVLQKYHIELNGLQSMMQKTMLSDSELSELQSSVDRMEHEKFAIGDNLNSKRLKKAEIDKALQQLPLHDQMIEKLERCKALRSAVTKGTTKQNELKDSGSKLTQIREALSAKETIYRTKSGEFQQMQGSNHMIGRNLKELKIEHSKPDYKDIERVITDLNTKFILTRDISAEVSEKMDALEESLMRYHHEKMKEINSTLADFWRLTYKGNDIETIEIKSDVEKDKINSRVKSYNYRIVLKTHDEAELDMKGRCSAGQKVLASFIIRLSLAETFCQNCGILALDEPTTNLDQDNIEGLAHALKDIIERQKKQDSFQLIIITHDDMFVQCLGADFTEHYWRIEKDNNSYSTINKRLLRDML